MRKAIGFFLATLALTATSCSKYGYVSLSYPLEPEVYLPENVHSIAIVNRSLTTENEKNAKVWEAIISTEIGSDFLASDASIKGVFDGVSQLPNTEIVFPMEVRMLGTGTAQLPDILDWKLVKEICDREGADLLLVLESFDSNTDLLVRTATEQISSVINTGKPKTSPPSQAKLEVSAYWRLYDPLQQSIVDQYQHKSNMMFDTYGGAPPPDALPRTAYEAGLAYVDRYLPGAYRVKRKLYKRTSGAAKQQFKAGYRRTEVANWRGAMEVWRPLSEHSKRKTAGRACLNMAVSNEVLGDTETALEWSQKSYEFYRDKLGRDYSKVLLRRKRLEGL